ncbi:MAG: LapA family protein, partial [Desulfarculaceae bacterium]
MLIYAKWVGLGLLVLIAVTFSVKNAQNVTISYFFVDPMSLPLYGLIFIIFFIGMCFGLLLPVIIHKNKKNIDTDKKP